MEGKAESEFYGKYLMSSHYLNQIIQPEVDKTCKDLINKGHAIRKADGLALTEKWHIDYAKEKQLRAEKAKGPKKYCFITIQDLQRSEDDLGNLKQFIKDISYMYSAGWWCIESGKKSYHIHMLVKIKNNKKHKDSLCIKWASLFDTNLRDKDYYDLKTHNDSPDMPEYNTWLAECLDYFDDSKKSESHKNATDLKLRGTFGTTPGAWGPNPGA